MMTRPPFPATPAMRRLFPSLPHAAAAAAVVLAGCATPQLHLSMEEPGEFKLTDVSKIAVLDFNSLPGDVFSGGEAADKETCALVQRAVCAALSGAGSWDVARLDVERVAAQFDRGILPSRRFDAILYGRIWWQFPPERHVMKPALFTLETKTRVAYMAPKTADGMSSASGLGNPLASLAGSMSGALGSLGSLGSAFGSSPRVPQATAEPENEKPPKQQEEQRFVDLVTETRDELALVGHRSREATLMLALGIYRVRADGGLEKIADTVLIVDDGYRLDNGVYSSCPASFGAFGAAVAPRKAPHGGETELPSNAITLPSELQAELSLALRAAADVSRRIAPHKRTQVVTYSFSDGKILHLLRNAAYAAAEAYAIRSVRVALGAEVAAEVAPLQAYDPPEEGSVPHSDPDDAALVAVEDRAAAVAAADRLVVKKGCAEALFALAVSQEATGRAEQALYTYRYVFSIEPDAASAAGIARCLEEVRSAARIAEQSRSIRKAGARASME